MIDKNISKPLYIKIKEDLINKITEDKFKIDEKIPSENELTQLYDVSKITIRKSLYELVNEGYLYREQGKGTFVAKRKINRLLNLMSFTEEMRSKGLECKSKVLNLEKVKDKTIAKEMDILPTESIIKVERLRLVDNNPIALQTSYIPESIVELGQIKKIYEEHSLYKILKGVNIYPHKAHEKYNADVLNDKNLSEIMEMERGKPVFRVRRYTYTEDNLLFEYALSILKGNMYTMEVVLDQ